MAIPRSALITGVTNDPFYNGEDKIPTSLALSERLSAQTLSGTLLNLDNLTDSGCYSYPSNASSLPKHMLGSTGLVFVFRNAPTITDGVFGTSDTTVSTANNIRQIVWPRDNGIPYTRIKDASSSNAWTTWNPITGTNPIVLIDKNMTAVPNTTYYGYSGGYTLTLPNPENLESGTSIFLVQIADVTTVTDGNTLINVPHRCCVSATKNVWSNDANTRNNDVMHQIGPQFYLLKVEQNVVSSNGGQTITVRKEWKSYAKNGIEQALENHEQRFDSKEKITRVLHLGYSEINMNTTVLDVYGNTITIDELIKTTNPTIVLTVPVESESQLFILPNAGIDYVGTEVTLILNIPNQKVTVRTQNSEFEELFTNNYTTETTGFGTQGMVLKFICINSPTAGGYTWSLIGFVESESSPA